MGRRMKCDSGEMTSGWLLTIVLMLFLVPAIVSAQNEIVENPAGAVKLRRIWYKAGPGILGQEVGTGAGPLYDINRDGANDFAVRVGLQWQVFLGGDPSPGSEPVWIFDSALYPGVRIPVVGDFYGNGDTLVGFYSHRPERPDNPTRGFPQIHFFRRKGEIEMLSSESSLQWDAGMTMDPPIVSAMSQVIARDLDGDGADELVLVLPEVSRDAGTDTRTEIWIFRGGQNFTVAEPTLIVKDSEPNELGSQTVSVSVDDLDGDGRVDVCLGVNYGTIPKLKFWWGSSGSPWNWTNTPDRVLQLPPGSITPSFDLIEQFRDYDGDSVMDLTGRVLSGEDAGLYLWRSRSGNARTRAFDQTDYDHFFPGYVSAGSFGYVGDSTNRYQMLALRSSTNPGRTIGLAGGPNGPNTTYDAYYGEGDGPSGGGISVGDVNGDGWEDRISFSSTFGGPGVGAAAIIAGGPYIPNDDPTVGVHEVGVAGEPGGLYLWPNPVGEKLHIAWRGGLERQPSYLTVHDMAGRLIVEGEVEDWRGEALWRCGSVASGCYTLTVYDQNGRIISSASVFKR